MYNFIKCYFFPIQIITIYVYLQVSLSLSLYFFLIPRKMATWLYINNETVSPITWMTSRASVPGKCFTTDISSQNTSRGFCKHEYNIIFNNLHLRAKVNTHTHTTFIRTACVYLLLRCGGPKAHVRRQWRLSLLLTLFKDVA